MIKVFYLACRKSHIEIIYYREEKEVTAMNNANDFVITGNELIGYTGVSNIVEIPGGIEYIRPLAFINQTHITAVTFPESLRHIGHHAFFGCQNLAQVVIPKSVTTIDACAFMLCEGLESVVVEGTLQSVGESAFSNTPFLLKEYEKRQGLVTLGNCVLGYSSADEYIEELVIPEGIVSIADEAFAYYFEKKIFKRVVFPDSLYRIGERAFFCMEGLEGMYLGEGFREFGKESLWGCDNLEDMDFHDEFDSSDIIMGKAFLGGTKWEAQLSEEPQYQAEEKPELKAGIDDLQYQGWSLESIEASGEVVVLTKTRWEQIQNEYRQCMQHNVKVEADRKVRFVVLAYTDVPFWDLGHVIVAKYPNTTDFEVWGEDGYVTVDGIVYSLAYRDSSHTIMLLSCPPGKKGHCQIPEGVTYICSQAFYGTKISSVTIPETVRSLDMGAFECCDKLTDIRIPRSVECIGDQEYANPFINCKKLESITVDINNRHYYSWGGLLFHRYGDLLCFPAGRRGQAVIPNSCWYMEHFAFAGCRHVPSLELPRSINRIDGCVFTNAYGLESIVLPVSVNKIGEEAFNECRKLSHVYFFAPKVEFEDDNIFRKCRKKLCLHGLPGSGVEEYAKRNGFCFEQILAENEFE